jgi:acetoin utilization protein AcuB
MQSRVLTCRPEDQLSTAAQMMLWAGIRHIPVVDQEKVVGLLNERDIAAHNDEFGMVESVGSIMQRPRFANPEDGIAEVAMRMQTEKIDGLPVVEAGKLAGIVTTTDVLAYLVRSKVAPPVSKATVDDIMTADPDSAHLDDLFLDAVGRMTHRGVRHLPVVDGDQHVVGMLSDRDVRTAVGNLFASDKEGRELSLRLEYLRVADVAAKKPVTVRQNAPIDQAVRFLIDHRVGALPVVDADDRLVGIVSYIDVLARNPEIGRSNFDATRPEQPIVH